MHAQWKYRVLLALLLLGPLASSAYAQLVPIDAPVPLNPGQIFTYPDNIDLRVPFSGDVFVAPFDTVPPSVTPATLNINGGAAILTGPNTTDSALVVNGGGPAFPNKDPTAINVIVDSSLGSPGPINLTTSGYGVFWLEGANAQVNATGSTAFPVTFTGEGNPIAQGPPPPGTRPRS